MLRAGGTCSRCEGKKMISENQRTKLENTVYVIFTATIFFYIAVMVKSLVLEASILY